MRLSSPPINHIKNSGLVDPSRRRRTVDGPCPPIHLDEFVIKKLIKRNPGRGLDFFFFFFFLFRLRISLLAVIVHNVWYISHCEFSTISTSLLYGTIFFFFFFSLLFDSRIYRIHNRIRSIYWMYERVYLVYESLWCDVMYREIYS